MNIKNIDISVALVGKDEIKKLNQKYRKKNRSTDVLSFAYHSECNKVNREIIICYPLAKQQAKKFKHLIREEMSNLLVHGFLHLLGYKHSTIKTAKAMEELELKIKKLVAS